MYSWPTLSAMGGKDRVVYGLRHGAVDVAATAPDPVSTSSNVTWQFSVPGGGSAVPAVMAWRPFRVAVNVGFAGRRAAGSAVGKTPCSAAM